MAGLAASLGLNPANRDGARSAGRVQSVATRLVVDRERERMAFVTASYFDIEAQLDAGEAAKPPVFGPPWAQITSAPARTIAFPWASCPRRRVIISDRVDER